MSVFVCLLRRLPRPLSQRSYCYFSPGSAQRIWFHSQSREFESLVGGELPLRRQVILIRLDRIPPLQSRQALVLISTRFAASARAPRSIPPGERYPASCTACAVAGRRGSQLLVCPGGLASTSLDLS